ncbi:HAD family hydrolase [Stigmatella aurantiaca]|uniref:HAD-superfamily subfamily IB hydrolase n=1 Tax=Stigmatella aurantiaca (strain DW4/3-1) TaxID=378806 RepID=Q08UZ9_STIAD|nr:HAD family hydrolase [Stigmatella aurantiaca]ADO71206.1 HAD-superfamily subfamily IB hydrolase [Stigmatella aurantiaca DW4/3-1]EAU64303.1 HAD-superfamily subfamily IB hydrolase [Stigmatella aurantiaca DW4/3-1]
MSVAFFDLDKTLLAVNSASLWIRRELALGHITRWQALRASLWMARYHLGFVSMQDALRAAIGHLAGTEALPIQKRTTAFYEEQVRPLYRPGALLALEDHRNAGDRLVLLTSSTGYLSELVARDLRLDAILCNRFEVNADGLHTGKPLGIVCFGEGKRTCAEAYAKEVGAPLSSCSFYTDSYSDLPVMEVVGKPVAVHPDHRLRREALRRGWPVVDWGVPRGGSPLKGASGAPQAGASPR